MPKQKRWAIKRDLDYAVGNIQASQEKIVKVGEQFKGVHDEYYQALLGIFGALELVITAIEKLRNDI